MDNKREQKKRIRQIVLNEMANIIAPKRKSIEQFFVHQLLETSEWCRAECIGITRSMYPEWETRGIIEEAFRQGKRVAVPIVVDRETMQFIEISKESTFTRSRFGVEEPDSGRIVSDLDLLVVPGVAFDEQGNRIGFGGGYYDRFLDRFSGDTVALVHSVQLRSVPVEPHDQIIKKIIMFRGDRSESI